MTRRLGDDVDRTRHRGSLRLGGAGSLELVNALEGGEGDFDLIERRFTSGQPLQPETGASSTFKIQFERCLPAKRISS